MESDSSGLQFIISSRQTPNNGWAKANGAKKFIIPSFLGEVDRY
jgi:hypothetical protein